MADCCHQAAWDGEVTGFHDRSSLGDVAGVVAVGELVGNAVDQAHASAYHWLPVGAPENFARSHWLCSRVYCVLGRAEPALYHARLVLEICERHGIGDWDLAYAYEALARAHAVAGDRDEAGRWLERARLASADVTEDDDRDLLLGDLETVPI